MNIGDLLLKLSTLAMLVALVSAFRWARGHTASERTFRWAYHAMTATLGVAAVLLMRAFLVHDFRYEYVAGYSSSDLPLLYLVSGFWAGQQGTFLLWGLIAALVGYALLHRNAWCRAAVMAAYVPTIGFMHVLMLDPGGNPFGLLPTTPADGQGLNPLLQDPWMATHPPIVFLGYVAATVPAVLALVALVRRADDQWVAPALRWALASFVTLGAGIVLGGFWAYKVLGWGGYWGWDPVENASLVPWITITALVHGLIVQQTKHALRRTNLVLALVTYLLVVYSTFLTRSGVLADFSVHSFGVSSIYRILLAGLIVIVAASVWGFVRRGRLGGESVETSLSWPFVLSAAVLLFAVSAALILIGTSWPILSGFLGQPAAPKPDFYNRVNLPLYVGLLALLAIGPFLTWVKISSTEWRTKLGVSVAAGLVAAAVAFAAGARGPGSLLLVLVAVAALTANLLRFVQMARLRVLSSGAALAHLGFALMFVGIVASDVYSDTAEVVLPYGQPVEALGRIMVFQGPVPDTAPQERWRISVLEPDGEQRDAEVTIFAFMSRGQRQELRRPGILRASMGDLYIAPGGLQWNPTSAASLQLKKDEPYRYGGAELTFRGFDTSAMGGHDAMRVAALIDVAAGDASETLSLVLEAHGSDLHGVPIESAVLPSATLTLERLSVEQGMVLVRVKDGAGGASGALAIEASTKPLINLLWLGTFLLGTGCAVAFARRVVDARRMPAPGAAVEARPPLRAVGRRQAS